MPTPEAAGAGTGITVRGALTPEQAAGVAALAGEAAAADEVSPLSEQALLTLRHAGDTGHDTRHLLLHAGGDLAGYAQLTRGQDGEATGELVIRPAARRAGLGRQLLGALLTEAGGPAGVWAHGDRRAAAALAAAAGLERTRALWQLRLPADAPLASPRIPDGVQVRAFAPGRDEQAWLELNRRAFAAHPEQGAWSMADLQEREAEPWFDPAGFFLAQRGGALAGFHWTKVHPATPAAKAAGEVYVVGVDPAEQGTGLGRALTLTGLHYLRGRGLEQVMLYAEEDNAAAIGLYQSLGFRHAATDVVYTGAPPVS